MIFMRATVVLPIKLKGKPAPEPRPLSSREHHRADETSPEEDNTVSSASLCMSPSSAAACDRTLPLCASTPYAQAHAHARALHNGHDAVDNKLNDTVNGNVNVNIVCESTTSMDVLSGGESEAGDTLTRRNNNSISSNLLGTLKESTNEMPRKRNTDVTYFVAKELLMTERTYKRDLELVTVKWSARVSALSSAGADVVTALARACLALEPLALPAGALLARLERTLTAPSPRGHDDNEEPEYRKIAELLHDYLSSTSEAYTTYVQNAGTLVGLVESVRRCNPAVSRECAAFDSSAPLPLSCLLLRPLHRLLHYERLAAELCQYSNGPAQAALDVARDLAHSAREQLQHVENHAALCQLQRDLTGYDKLLVAEREFVRMGCVYKHSNRGLQQRMLFLFNDVLVISSKSNCNQFRAHVALPLHNLQVKPEELPHSFTLTGEVVNVLLNANNEQEFQGWYHALEDAIYCAKDRFTEVDTELTPYEQEIESSTNASGSSGSALTQVCWHRVTSMSRDHLHIAMRTQLSGYLLRKFKKSPGWQKLWVVFAAFTLFFYKSWQDETPLASLPLLGYSVGPPAPIDGIEKEFVFKLQFKNHVYFFRADSHFTYNRWTEVLQTSTLYPHHSN